MKNDHPTENPHQTKFGAKIQKLRETWQWTRTQLANKIGVSMPYISQIENGTKLPTEKRLEELIGALVQSPPDSTNLADDLRRLWYKAKTFEETQHLKKFSTLIKTPKTDTEIPGLNDTISFMEDSKYQFTPEKHGFKKVPIISWVTAGTLSPVIDEYPVGYAEDWVYSDVKSDRAFALRVQGDSMEDKFHDGQIIVVDPDQEAGHDDFVIVRDNEENTATFKQLRKVGDKFILHPLNPKYPDIFLDESDRWSISGKVMQIIENL